MANVCLELAKLGGGIKPVHVQYIALQELSDLLGALPIQGDNPASPSRWGERTNPKRVEAVGPVAPRWMLATCSDLAAAIRGPIARIARSIRADLAHGGELVMLPQRQSRACGGWEHVTDPRRGLHMRLDYTDTCFIFSVLYQIQDTAETARREWLDDLLSYSLAEA